MVTYLITALSIMLLKIVNLMKFTTLQIKTMLGGVLKYQVIHSIQLAHQ